MPHVAARPSMPGATGKAMPRDSRGARARSGNARLLICAAALACACQATAQEKDKRSLFTDPQDGALDASEWLLDRKGFLPVPIVITEPAVGYGAGAALLFFRESIRERTEKAGQGHRLTPPDIYLAAFAATENGTKVVGAGGLVTFDDDRWRWRGGIGLPDVNLDFYGAVGKLGTGDHKIGYNIDGPFYQLPFIELRGIPVVRFQDQSAGALETELRWNVTPRWALIGFLGYGRAWGTSTSFGDADSVTTKGAGFRYLIARRLGLYAGVDIAKGPEDTALYIQAGSAWR